MRGLGAGILFAVLCVSNLDASQSVLSRLENGDIVSNNLGNTIAVHGIVRKNYNEMKSILGGNINALALRTPGLSFIKAFRTDENRALFYIKVRGLQDGSAFLMELKSANQEANKTLQPLFMNAQSLPLLRQDLALDSTMLPLYNPLLSEIRSEITHLNSSSPVERALGSGSRELEFVLDGPLNPGLSLAGLRIQMKVELKAYDISSLNQHTGDPLSDFFPKIGASLKEVSWTYLTTYLSFRSAVPKEDFGDYRGFRAHRLAAAELGAKDFVRDLRSVLESM